ncbi:unnamed protein product, partial [Urochloa humidicola]
ANSPPLTPIPGSLPPLRLPLPRAPPGSTPALLRHRSSPARGETRGSGSGARVQRRALSSSSSRSIRRNISGLGGLDPLLGGSVRGHDEEELQSFFIWPSSHDAGFGDEFNDSTYSLPKYTGIPMGSAIQRAAPADILLPIRENSRETTWISQDLGLNGCWRTILLLRQRQS